MEIDETESIRRNQKTALAQACAALDHDEATIRLTLETAHGQVYDSQQLRENFEVLGFMAPYVTARCKATGELGSLQFTHSPRFYYLWVAD